MKPSPARLRISIDGVRYRVDCLVYPARPAPHVGADSPRFMDPGSPLRVEAIRVRPEAEQLPLGHLARAMERTGAAS